MVSGLCIPGVPIIGNMAAGGSSGSADLTDIDMTATALNARAKLQIESHHAYYTEDGTLQYAPPNAWPQEFIDGVAVGRHEPEPQATNYVPHSNDLSKAAIYADISVAQSGTNWRGLPGYLLSGPYSYSFAGIATFTAVAGQHYTLSVIADLSTAQQLRFEFNRSSTARRSYVFTSTKALESGTDDGNVVTLHGYKITQLSDGVYRFSATASFATTGLIKLNIGVNKQDATPAAIVYFCQAEDGDIATSPIMTTGAPATRAAGFGRIRVYPGLTGLRISYTDGTTDTITLPPEAGDWYQLPFSSRDWGARYIQRISYFKE